MRRVTVADLPESTSGEFLFCPRCGQEWSATRGDYFFHGEDHVFTGRGPVGLKHRKTNLQLVRRESRVMPA